MKNYLKIFMPFAAAMLIGSLTFVFAQTKNETKPFPKVERGEKGDFGRMPPPPNGLNPRIFDKLGLTDAQKTQIKTLMESSRSASQTYFEKLRVIDEQIRDTTETGTFDEAQARQLLKAKAELQIEMDLIRLKSDSAVYNLLTAEQIARIALLKQERPEFPPHGDFRPGMPPPPSDQK